MENLIPIGRFSRMTRLSIKALRFYDQIGVLKPAWVDPSSSHTLAGWIQEHGHEMSGPPREVYLNDPTSIGEAEQLTRVEWPIED